MSSENFWELFAKTGDIAYYLLYKISAKALRPGDHSHGEKAGCAQ